MNLSEIFVLYKQKKGLRGRTEADYESCLRTHCHALLCRDMKSITRDEMVDFYIQLKAKSLANANKARRILGALYRFARAYSNDLTLQNPLEALTEMRIVENLPRRRQRIYEGQFGAFFSAVELLPRQDKAWLLLLLYTGLRHAALAEADWSWMDWSRGVLTIPNFAEKNGEMREVFLSAVPLDMLKRLHARQRCPSSGWIFPGLNRRCYELVRNRSGVWCRPHDLRRTHASICSELGYNRYVVKHVLGHKDDSDVTQGYNHFSDKFLREVNRKIIEHMHELAGATEPERTA